MGGSRAPSRRGPRRPRAADLASLAALGADAPLDARPGGWVRRSASFARRSVGPGGKDTGSFKLIVRAAMSPDSGA